MPSGSHWGSPGGHSSGGSSIGGGWNSNNWGWGRNSNSGNKMPKFYTFNFFGRTYTTSQANKIRSVVSLVVFLLILSVFMGFGFIWDGKQDIRKVETDRAYYLQMIEYAEEHPEFQKEGVVTDKFYNEDDYMWYFEYTIDYVGDDGLIHKLKGYTFSVYTFTEISKIIVGERLNFAVNNKDVRIHW